MAKITKNGCFFFGWGHEGSELSLHPHYFAISGKSRCICFYWWDIRSISDCPMVYFRNHRVLGVARRVFFCVLLESRRKYQSHGHIFSLDVAWNFRDHRGFFFSRQLHGALVLLAVVHFTVFLETSFFGFFYSVQKIQGIN